MDENPEIAAALAKLAEQDAVSAAQGDGFLRAQCGVVQAGEERHQLGLDPPGLSEDGRVDSVGRMLAFSRHGLAVSC